MLFIDSFKPLNIHKWLHVKHEKTFTYGWYVKGRTHADTQWLYQTLLNQCVYHGVSSTSTTLYFQTFLWDHMLVNWCLFEKKKKMFFWFTLLIFEWYHSVSYCTSREQNLFLECTIYMVVSPYNDTKWKRASDVRLHSNLPLPSLHTSNIFVDALCSCRYAAPAKDTLAWTHFFLALLIHVKQISGSKYQKMQKILREVSTWYSQWTLWRS